MYQQLEAYHKEHGHSNVPSMLKTSLSYWVRQQRQARRNEEVRMTPERIAHLDRLGFNWGSKKRKNPDEIQQPRNDKRWQEMYKKIKAYKEEHGHCKVPIQANEHDPELGPLGIWVSYQRQKRDIMQQSKKDLLDEIGFHWYADNWDTMYEQLVKFKRQKGHTNVPTRYAENRSLGVWCRKQRAKMRQNKLPPERRSRMEEIQFDYELQSEKNERIWNEKFQRLRKYKLQHGDCLVPTVSSNSHQVEDRELSIWVQHQRINYKKGKCPPHRVDKLNSLGFVWSLLAERGPIAETEKNALLWENSYNHLREFYEKHGHFTIQHMLDDGRINPLNTWINTQRTIYAQGEMKEERRKKLDDINFIWLDGLEHHSRRLWDAAFEKLNIFHDKWDTPLFRSMTTFSSGDGLER